MYGNELSENGLKRVMETRSLGECVNYNYFYTQTGVDHASIYTGMLPRTWNRVEGVVRSFTPETPVFYPIRSFLTRSVINRRIV